MNLTGTDFTTYIRTVLILLVFISNSRVNAAFGASSKNASASTQKPPTTESELEFEGGPNPPGPGSATKTNHGHRNNLRYNQPPSVVATEEPEIEAEEMSSPNPSSWTFGWPGTGIGLWGQPSQSTEGPEEIELPVNSGMVTARPGTCRNFEDKEIDRKIILNHKGCQIEISQEEIIKKFGKPGAGAPSVHIRTIT